MTSLKTAPLSSQLVQTEVPIQIPMTYLHLNQGPQKPLLIFFHGYTDTGAGFLKRAFPEMDEKYEILAPNGLFPVPVKIEHGWKQTFAWYFMDFARNQMLMPPSVAVDAVVHLIEKLNLQDRPKILLGFSQGGFFLPFLFPKLRNVQKMFGIGAAYRSEDYPEKLPIPLDAFHGKDDSVITFQRAQESFQALSSKNPTGEFHGFEGLKHTMNNESRDVLKRKIDNVFFPK